MTAKYALPVAGGILSGAMLGALMTGVPAAMLFLYAVPLPLYVAGLSLGTGACALAVAAGTAAATFMGGITMGGPFLVLFGAPAVFIVWKALSSRTTATQEIEWYPVGNILGWLALFALAGIVAAAFAAAGSEGGFEGEIRRMVPEAVNLLFEGPVPPELARRIEQWARLFPAMLAMVWIAMTALNAALAETVLARKGRAKRPQPAWLSIEAPGWTPYAFSAAVILGAIGPPSLRFVGENLAPVLAMPYFFVGVAVAHSLARRLRTPALALVIFYMILILLGFVAMVLVAALGFAEMWLGLRRRAGASGRP
ncbi:MAG: DUF2232 domain-containing protein [Alphaproteobacteria bacterium]